MFSSQEIEQKIERFFGLIDEDGNGELSWDEILNLCHRSFQSMKNVEERPEDEEFFDELSEYFTKYIFEQTEVPLDEEITPDQLRAAIEKNNEGADLLEMFCGEALINLR